MTRDDIIRLAVEAKLVCHWDGGCASAWVEGHDLTPYLERFAALVAAAECERNDAYIKSLHESVSWQAERVIACLKALDKAVLAEREACAKVCDDWPNGRDDVYSIGVAIRARGQE
jgi:hypothetical protein